MHPPQLNQSLPLTHSAVRPHSHLLPAVSSYKLQHINLVLTGGAGRGSLFIGDTICALQPEYLVANKIGAILCCNVEASNLRGGLAEIDFEYMAVEDHPSFNILGLLGFALQYIRHKLKEGKNVLVQCHAGVSRSATVVLAFLMRELKWPLRQAFEYLKHKRPRVKPNEGFWRQLEQFEAKVREKSKPERKNRKQLKKSRFFIQFQEERTEIVLRSNRIMSVDQQNIEGQPLSARVRFSSIHEQISQESMRFGNLPLSAHEHKVQNIRECATIHPRERNLGMRHSMVAVTLNQPQMPENKGQRYECSANFLARSQVMDMRMQGDSLNHNRRRQLSTSLILHPIRN